ncbi:alpha/beta hydrolase [Haloferula sp. BvORR071]|uniref:alpha/beta hydrolase n=1 Tax=Haloferula sp. BvORR071 TaxID=1396141 RepID=UPI000695CB91|nr:alpha/beta hydrolase [Haloferula sp. BvORR071]
MPKRSRLLLLAASSLVLAPLSALSQEEVSPAAAKEAATAEGDFQFECVHADRPIQVYGYRPSDYQGGLLLVLFHGASRNAKSYRDGGRVLARKLGMLLLVPEFDRARFDVAAYQEGGVMKDGKVQARDQWTFAYLHPLLQQVFQREGKKLPYYLVGHSAGAQFLGRMAALYPNEAQRMILVNPGSLMFPDRAQKYPYGFGGLPEEMASDAAIQRYLAAPLTLYLGTGDVGLKNLSTGEKAMKQGTTRIERGRNCLEAGKQLAASKQWKFSWRRVEAEGLDHPSLPMWNHANCRLAILGTPESSSTPGPPGPAE